jgi:glutamate---cysteine ligase / carboxylate-amine ligase
MPLEAFKSSGILSLGVELELQILASHNCDLTRGASDLLAVIERTPHPGDIKPEITESMIEINSSIHQGFDSLVAELRAMRDVVVAAADKLNLRICGGGAHPFQHWEERTIFDMPRFHFISDLYGYLAKQFTVFGQHVHVGCSGGDEALYLLHSLSRYVPHFIALTASSPFYQGVDTAFDSSRLNAVFAFPLSGRAPFVLRWNQFEDYFAKMQGLGIVAGMKDFYWDIRPKPEYGTIEVRVCDTPLTVEMAAAVACYIQALCRYLLVERPRPPREDDYLPYTYNRFQACRFGLEGNYVDPVTSTHGTLRDGILATLDRISQHARELESEWAMAYLRSVLRTRGNDAQWVRKAFQDTRSLNEVMREQSRRWRSDEPLLPA